MNRVLHFSCALALSSFFLTNLLLAQSVLSFSGRRIYTTAPAAAHLTLADVNGDGKLDLVASTTGVEVFLGTGTGQFGPGVSYGDTSLYSDQNEVGDFNGDGKPDIFVSALPNYQPYVVLGNGDGTFGPPKFTSVSGIYGMALADVNGDGKLDAVVVGTSGITILLGNGNGTFTVGANYSGSYNKVAIADVNHDGKLDFFVTSRTGVTGYLGNGDGTFFKKSFTALTLGGLAVALADMNGDGNLDVVVTTNSVQPGVGPGQVAVLLGNGDGTVGAPTYFGNIVSSYTVAVGDVNGDGKLDVVTADVAVFLGNGNGGLGTPVFYQIGSAGKGAKLGDLNGDGKLDLVAVDSDSGDLSVLLNNGAGKFEDTTSVTATGATGYLATGIFDGDSEGDLAYTTASGVNILLGTGSLVTPFKTGQSIALSQSSYIISGDWNGDHRADLMVVNATDGAISYLRGLGHGTFAAPATVATGIIPNAIASGDFNKDGKLDLITSTGLLYLGNGDGTFAAPITLPGTSQSAYGYLIAVGDYNGDGNLDVVLAQNGGSKLLQLFLGQGNGTFNSPVTLTSGDLFQYAVAANLNADAYTDLVAVGQLNQSGTHNGYAVYTGSASGLTQSSTSILNYAKLFGTPLVADFNGDSQMDLAIPVNNAYLVGYFLGSSGTFTADSDFGTGLGPIGAVTGKFHNRGTHPDVATANTDGTISVQFNLLP